MKGIVIYVEGGGNSTDQKAVLRRGFDALLSAQKQAAQEKSIGWKLVLSGGREQAYNAFINRLKSPESETLYVLLVDSEGDMGLEQPNAEQVNAEARVQHLVNCDRWDLTDVNPKQVHLMVQCMEAWVIADLDALADFYGQHFLANALPSQPNLEQASKTSIYEGLKRATRKSQKGEYAKIKHASKLLEKIDASRVAARCPRFKTFITWLTEQIARV